MDGIHDLGGLQGFGPVDIETDEPVFHDEWERRVFALSQAAAFVTPFNTDQFRRQIEKTAPRQYLNSSYYELWFAALIALLKERQVVSEEELDRTGAIDPLPAEFDPGNQAMASEMLEAVKAGSSQAMPDAVGRPHRFTTGERVRTQVNMTTGHNRLPRFARGRTGTVIAERGIFVLADANAVGEGPDPQMLYTVEFVASDLWGSEAEERASVCLDLWDAYLMPVE